MERSGGGGALVSADPRGAVLHGTSAVQRRVQPHASRGRFAMNATLRSTIVVCIRLETPLAWKGL